MYLQKTFYGQPTIKLAKALLGKMLVYNDGRSPLLAGRIAETEAYLYKNDPACHAAKGRTKRNAAMFGPPGQTYVYLIYGMYHCLNIVSSKEGIGEAVLIRALEPVSGLEIMAKRRGLKLPLSPRQIISLCNGPGKLTQAFGLTKKHNGLSLIKPPLSVFAPQDFTREFGLSVPQESPRIQSSGRIGIMQGKELQLRFVIKACPFVSGVLVSGASVASAAKSCLVR